MPKQKQPAKYIWIIHKSPVLNLNFVLQFCKILCEKILNCLLIVLKLVFEYDNS